MVTNFDFLPTQWQYLRDLGMHAEQNIYRDPRAAATELRLLAEKLTDLIIVYTPDVNPNHASMSQYEKLTVLSERNVLDPAVIDYFHIIRRVGNNASHSEDDITTDEVMNALEKASVLCNWFMKVFVDHNFQPQAFVKPLDHDQITRAEITALKQELAIQKQNYEAKLASQRTQTLTLQEKQTRQDISRQFINHNVHLNEQDTRLLIDEQLSNAGWEVDTAHLNYWTHHTTPQKGHNMAIAEWPCDDHKRADYALFIGTQLIGIIEAKKYDHDIPGDLFQAKEYAKHIKIFDGITLAGQWGEYRVPFIYSTNGRKFLRQVKEKSGIWYWDARQPYQSAYALPSWHSPRDLKRRLQKDDIEANHYLDNNHDYPEFANRDYQVKAIQTVEKALTNHRRKMLLAMATGTGKTRVALAIMYRLLVAKKAKRILYVVDRVSLAEQTYDALCNIKVNGTALNKIYEVKGVHQGSADMDTRIHITTIQSLIKSVLFDTDNHDKPSVGTYDFIIVDEAHRGYTEDKCMSDEELTFANTNDYVSQYRRVLDYFDAPALGLTATPALQTTEIFGMPIYTYSYSDAVIDGYLVDHNPPHIMKTKLSEQGIKLTKGSKVTVINRKTSETGEVVLGDDLNFDIAAFNKRVITKPFNDAIAMELAQQLDPEIDEGKTLIFAATDAHADMIVDSLKHAYQTLGKQIHDDAIMKITGTLRNPEDAIRHFKNEKYPNIVVTVDLLTTGIDVPKIRNLVFLRRVRSRILYDQMLGRATRLCPEIDKTSFDIYDAVHLYDALENITDMKPIIKQPNVNYSQLLNCVLHATDQQEFNYYKRELIAKLQRHKQRLTNDVLNKVAELNNVRSIDHWLHELKGMNQHALATQCDNIKRLATAQKPSLQYIVENNDEYITTERGYGNNNVAPKTYLDEFTQYIRTHINDVPALQVAVNHPRDLKIKDLHDILLILERQGFSKQQLQKAWQHETSQSVTADIISFIRQAALGDPLEDSEIRIHHAMQKVYSLHDWTTSQKKWLQRIEKQLQYTSVLGPDAQSAFNDNELFREKGGYLMMKRIFGNDVETIVDIINNNLYKQVN